jgi:hypothetical protein
MELILLLCLCILEEDRLSINKVLDGVVDPIWASNEAIQLKIGKIAAQAGRILPTPRGRHKGPIVGKPIVEGILIVVVVVVHAPRCMRSSGGGFVGSFCGRE